MSAWQGYPLCHNPALPTHPPPPLPYCRAGATLLRAADERVDAALNSASKVYTDNTAYLQQQLARQKEFHSANLETYRQAREAYLKKVGAAWLGAPPAGLRKRTAA